MKKLRLLFLSLFIIGFLSNISLYGQPNPGDFRSATSGTWGTLSTWETYTTNGGGSWVTASSIPDSNNTPGLAVTILAGHNVTVETTIGITNVTVNLGGTVTVTAPAVLYITKLGMTVNGSLIVAGNAPTATPYTVTVSSTANGTFIIGTTGIVYYDQGAAATGTKGAIPIATWQTGSTLQVDAVAGSATTSFASGGGQNFYNLIWNVTTSSGNFGLGLLNNTIGGNVTVLKTGASRLQLFTTNSGYIKIKGDLIVSGSAVVTLSGTSSTGIIDTISIYGNVNVNLTTGNFSLSRGSAANINIWNFYGDSVKIIGGTMQNSNPTIDSCKFVFNKPGTQYLTLSPASLSGSNPTPIEVANGTTLKLLSPVHVSTLFLSGGIIVPDASTDTLVMGYTNGTTVSIGGGLRINVPGSYVDGPVAYLYATAGNTTTKIYPIGKGGISRPLSLSFTQTAATLSTFIAEMFNSAPPSNTLSGALTNVSAVRYFTVSEGTGGSAFTDGSVKLSYGTDDGVNDSTSVRVAQGPKGGGTWVDLGGSGKGSPVGTITSSTLFSDLTNTIFTLGNVNAGSTLNLTAFLEGRTKSDGTVMENDIWPLTVTVELHNSSTLALVEAQTGVLSSVGVGTFTFTTAANGTPYYIAVKSINTVETWSATPQSFTGGALSYNFSSSADQAYGSNMVQKGSTWCIYSGDVVKTVSKIVDGADVIAIDNDNTYGVTDNPVTDITGDGIVDGRDVINVDNNNTYGIYGQAPDGAPTTTKRVMHPVITPKQNIK